MLRQLFLTIALLIAGAAYASPPVGQPAPDFTATDALSGKPVSLHDFKGKLVVLEWNNFNCPFVKKFYSVGEMQALQGNARHDGVIWISINSNAPGKDGFLATDAAAKGAVAERHAQPSYYLRDADGKIGHLYSAHSTPTMVVIDTDGNLAYEGAIDNKPSADPADIAGATNYVTEALTDLNAHRPVKISSTQSYGCFVHY